MKTSLTLFRPTSAGFQLYLVANAFERALNYMRKKEMHYLLCIELGQICKCFSMPLCCVDLSKAFRSLCSFVHMELLDLSIVCKE